MSRRELRRAKRTRRRNAAWIGFGTSDARVPCVLWDISATGARLAAARCKSLPSAFDLLLSNDEGSRRRCRVVWRNDRQLGVEFVAAVAPDDDVLDKSRPEHDEMRRLIAELRALQPDNELFDDTFRTLMRTVLHHVADEETVLLPLAEDVLGDELGALGWRMTKRRMELLRGHVGELTMSTARTFPVGTAAAAAGVLTLTWLLFRSGNNRPS
jgi:hypothetical protein